MKNKVLETIKDREKHYIKLTEQAIGYFIGDLKTAMEDSLFKDKKIELFVNDVGILPQNFRFCRIEGRLAKYTIGDTVQVESGESVEIELENFWDFAETFTMVIPFSLLDEPEVEKLVEYFTKVQDNDGKNPVSTSSSKIQNSDNTISEFIKVDKELDQIQKLSLRMIKNSSVH